jgi:hypothetical protein
MGMHGLHLLLCAAFPLVVAGASAEMNSEGLQKEIAFSELVAPAISLLKNCGRSDLVKEFTDQQDRFLRLCEATDQQIQRIKEPLRIEYQFEDCLMLQTALEALKNNIVAREEYISDLAILKEATTGLFTCG